MRYCSLSLTMALATLCVPGLRAATIHNETAVQIKFRELYSGHSGTVPPGGTSGYSVVGTPYDFRFEVEVDTFQCVVSAAIDGTLHVRWTQGGYQCLSLSSSGTFRASDPGYLDRNGRGIDIVGGTTNDFRFLVSADPQYWDGGDDAVVRNTNATQTLGEMTGRLFQSGMRGLILAGDLTNGAERDELDWYTAALRGFGRYVYDGTGNHDTDSDRVIRAVYDRRRATAVVNRCGSLGDGVLLQCHHYSWDWNGVHFVQLNLYPGNDPRPMDSLGFLADDLRRLVGGSGRPVVLVHHYGFDWFSLQNKPGSKRPRWWSEEQRRAYWNVIADYNVIAIFTGHLHPAEDAGGPAGWGIKWSRPAGASGGPDCINTFVSGAALHGVYLEAEVSASATSPSVKFPDVVNFHDHGCLPHTSRPGRTAWLRVMRRVAGRGLQADGFQFPFATSSPIKYFANQDARGDRGLDDWRFGSAKGECSELEAVTGLSKSPGQSRAHAIKCAPNVHPRSTTCVTRVFDSGDARGTTATGDWDYGYYKGECATNEYVAGVSQAEGRADSILCCVGRVNHGLCEPLDIGGGDALEAGAVGSSWDWDYGYHKAHCDEGRGRYVAGVSRDVSSGVVHRVLCCTP